MSTTSQFSKARENYEVFVKVANTWILSHDLDIEPPEGAATRSSGGRDPRAIWDRKQLKACGQLRTRLCELGQDYTEDDVTIERMMLTIKDNFELTGDAAYLKASGEFDKIHLDNYKTVDLYNKNFNELLTRIEKFQGVKICRPRAVDKYVNGLGVAFHSWLSSFWNAGNTLLDVPGGKKGVLLRFIMREAVAQEQRMAKHDADMSNTPLLWQHFKLPMQLINGDQMVTTSESQMINGAKYINGEGTTANNVSLYIQSLRRHSKYPTQPDTLLDNARKQSGPPKTILRQKRQRLLQHLLQHLQAPARVTLPG